MAQIHTFRHHYSLATQSLEMGLSYNFEVRNYPSYHIIKAQSLRIQGSFEEALEALNSASSLPGFAEDGKDISDIEFIPNLSERVTVYLERVKIESKLKKTESAAKIMQEALKTFADTHEEGRIVIANAG